VNAQFGPTAEAAKLTKDSLSIVDNRTGKNTVYHTHTTFTRYRKNLRTCD